MANIVLVYPMCRGADTLEHIGLEYLAATAREKGHCVKIIVYNINEDYTSLIADIKMIKPDVLGITVFSESLIPVSRMCEAVKKNSDLIHIYWGGHAASQSADLILNKHHCVDSIVVGEGEITFCELLESIDSHGSFEGIKGLVYRESSGIVKCTPPHVMIKDLDQLPFPARDIYIEAHKKPPIVLVSTSRGCIARCSFCSYSSTKNPQYKSWRGRSPEHVVDELEMLNKKYGMKTFFITDVTFEDPGLKGKARITYLAEDILKRGLDIHYEVHMRAENWKESDRDVLKLLAKSGLESTVVGLESGSPRGLKTYRKRAAVEDNLRIVRILKEEHITLEYGFITFNPYTDFQECYENLLFLKTAGLGYNISCFLTRLEVFPGVGIEKTLRKDKMLGDDYSYSNSIFNYKYKDERIKVLAESLCELPSRFDFINTLDELMTSINVLLRRPRRKYHDNIDLMKIIEIFINKVETLFNELVINNTDFFEECINLAFNGWNNDIFSSLINQYLITVIPEKINELKKVQMEFCRKLIRKGVDLTELHL